MQYIVANGWPLPYSIANNTISDLGVSTCGIYYERYVCSPWYSWMNASLVVLGFGMILGSLLLYYQLGSNRGNKLGFWGMGIGGVGTVLVGLFPANVASATHGIGAFLPFFIGNISLLLFGLYLKMPKTLRFFTLFSGILSLLALGLFYTENYLGLGIGGIERLVAHPQTFWLIIFGIYISSQIHKHTPLK